MCLLLIGSGCQSDSGGRTSAERIAGSVHDSFWPANGVFPVPGRTSSWTGFRAKNAERRTLFAQRRVEDVNAIVFVGDSITEGWGTLPQDFAELGVKIANRGIGGDTTPNLVYRLHDDVLALRPRALVILIGTNDLGEGSSPAQITQNLGEIRRRIRAAYPTIPVAWCLVMPRAGAEYVGRIRELNAQIAALARSDARGTLCDTFTPLALADGSPNPAAFVSDKLHLNPTGYRFWREALQPILAGWRLEAEASAGAARAHIVADVQENDVHEKGRQRAEGAVCR